MIPKDIKPEFLTGLTKFDKFLQKLEIMIINEMMADDGPVSMGLGNVSTHDARRTLSGQDPNNDMSYDRWKQRQRQW